MSAGSFSGVRLIMAAAARRAKASATKSWPSKRGPSRATKRSPGSRVRLSMETPVARQPTVLRPPVAASASAAVHRTRGISAPPP